MNDETREFLEILARNDYRGLIAFAISHGATIDTLSSDARLKRYGKLLTPAMNSIYHDNRQLWWKNIHLLSVFCAEKLLRE